MRLSGCSKLTRRPLTGTWYRALQTRFLPTALATVHTTTIPSRFSDASASNPGFEILYLASDHQVALFEVQALLGSPLPPQLIVPNPKTAWTIVNVTVNLSAVANLSLPRARRKIRTTIQELTGDWRGYALRHPNHKPTAPTQSLGAALFQVSDLEGFRTYSAKVPTQENLVVFPAKLRRNSVVRFDYVDSQGTPQSMRIP